MRRGFGVITVLLILVIAFCVKGTVFSKENHERAKENHYFAVLEDEYLEQAKGLLEEQGYHNCGVTMTRVTLEDGSREYTVLLHHRKLQKLGVEEREELLEALCTMEFSHGTCSFVYELEALTDKNICFIFIETEQMFL